MLNYSEFKDAITSLIKDYLPSEYADSEIIIHSVLKNNATKLDGLTIRTQESSICPNIYLNQFFTDYDYIYKLCFGIPKNHGWSQKKLKKFHFFLPIGITSSI